MNRPDCLNCYHEIELYGITGYCDGCKDGSRFTPTKREHKRKLRTNADLLRELPTQELADKIYNELAMFPSKSSLLQYLEQTAEP